MCGLAGLAGVSGCPADGEMVHRMTEMLAHRGPDGEGSRVGRQDRPSRLWSSVAFEEWAGLGLIAVARRPDDVLTDRSGPFLYRYGEGRAR
jgi:asparagine synthetase B (glutamine-hydrolysing)